MIVIPAIDIKDGRCVRLQQGQMSKETLYSEYPEQVAEKWFELGAERLHLVDLDGAFKGAPINSETIGNIVNAFPGPIQLGGGIRNIVTIQSYLDLGIDKIIIGTAAYKNPELVAIACKRFPERILLGIDANDGLVSVEGWTEKVNLTAIEMAKKFEGIGISSIIYTDILRDGMQTGPNLEATKKMAEAINMPIIASGGVSDIDDIAALLQLSDFGIIGAITGRALYEGTLDLAEAIKLVKTA